MKEILKENDISASLSLYTYFQQLKTSDYALLMIPTLEKDQEIPEDQYVLKLNQEIINSIKDEQKKTIELLPYIKGTLSLSDLIIELTSQSFSLKDFKFLS